MNTAIHHGSVVPGQPQVVMQQANPVTVNYPVNIQQNVSQPGVSESYSSAAGRDTGWVQFACGIGSLILGIVQIILGSVISYVGYGIWSAVLFYIPTGILGVVSHKKNSCVIVAYMVMSIISSLVGGCMMILAAISAGVSQQLYCLNIGAIPCSPQVPVARTAIDSILAITGLIEMIAAIVASAYCCRGVCCGATTPSTTRQTVVQYSSVPVVVAAAPLAQPAVYGQPTIQSYQPPMHYPQQQAYGSQQPAYPGQQQAFVPQPPMYQINSGLQQESGVQSLQMSPQGVPPKF